jgi:hypothetical protein
MRILTRAEEQTFKYAFDCICRVAAVTQTTKNIHEIKVSHGRELSSLPAELVKLFIENELSVMQHNYCPLYEVETMQKLIKHCFENKIQPKSYMFDGLLSIVPIKVQEYRYSDVPNRYSA